MNPGTPELPTQADDLPAQVRAALVVEARSSIDPASLGDDTPLDAPGFRLESMAFLRAMIALEDELDVRMDEELLARTKFATVGDVIAYVQASLATEADR